MSSSAPSHQNIPSSQTPVDPRAAKRAKTSPTSPSSGYPAPFATPSPMTPQSQAAAAAAAEAHRLRTGQLPAAGGFVHPPTDLPPRPYGGGSTSSPYTSPPKPPGKITGSQMQYLPDIEARLNRLESAVDKYVEIRGQKAVENSKLPGAGQQPGQQPTRK
ncbi:hypothetical protein BKA62DRAFT_670789 [Auriculariales sp. MPI-PUGE-AT-0066]|nr:hypothetical protein BKA62DRAFT_670789 [Auriculariales sp. MPI-PUGE-AT-0066]